MQINKIDSAPAFGAKLKLSGVNKKHWNLNSEEIKQLAYKAEEIGTSKDVVSFKIGKFGTFDNTEKMFRNELKGYTFYKRLVFSGRSATHGVMSSELRMWQKKGGKVDSVWCNIFKRSHMKEEI